MGYPCLSMINILTWDTQAPPPSPPDQNILPLGEISMGYTDHTHDGFNTSRMCAQIISKQSSTFCYHKISISLKKLQSKNHVKCNIQHE